MQALPCKFGNAQGHWEHRNFALASSRDYVHAIHAHSLLSIIKSTFPEPNHIDIATWQLQDADPALSPLLDPHCLAVFYDLGAQNKEKQRELYCHRIANMMHQSPP